jgi:predicted restriction endonuclease
VQNKAEFINALRQNFASTIKKIYINSLKTEVGFREIKVSEQKSLSRIMIDNENRKDIIYDA